MTVNITRAIYETSPIQRYAGNKLVEALRPTPSEEELVAELTFLPKFDPECRTWERHARLGELLSLTNIMVPLSAHCEFATRVDSMLRQSYVSRRPLSAEHMSIYQEIHQDRAGKREPFRQTHETLEAKLSTSLLGVPGMGKTTTVKRFLHRYSQVIYHSELDIYQIPWLHFEVPANGKALKSLLRNIVEGIADLIPENTYRQDYLGSERVTVEGLQSAVRLLLNKHCVGLLIADEIQNVANTSEGKEVVMSHLTMLANKSQAAVLYVGTPKAQEILGVDFGQGRRSIDLGMGDWNPLPRHELTLDNNGDLVKAPGEWVYVMSELWRYCYVQNPTLLTDGMLDMLYDCTQGIIDLAIKLLIVAQARAIYDGSETLSEQLVRAAYNDHFQIVHEMIDALRQKDWEAISKFGDLKSVDVKKMVGAIEQRGRYRRNFATTTKPGDPDFQPRLAVAAEVLGVPHADAQALARQVAETGTAGNMFEAAAQMAKNVAPLKRVNKGTTGARSKAGEPGQETAPSYRQLDERPDDLRHAVVAAANKGTSVVSELVALGMLPDVEDVICLD